MKGLLGLLILVAVALPVLAAPAPKPVPSMADFLAASPAADWAPLDPENTAYFDLPSGRVVLRLAPEFAPAHVANIRALLRAHFFDGLAVVRVQDNYVTQWGDAESKHDHGDIRPLLPDEYFRSLSGLPFTALPDRDAYAPQTGFSDGFPVARDPAKARAWLTHCYGMVGVGRDMPPDNGSGEELYTVIGHAPRHLDRNLAVVGRIVQGIELLSALPRGSGALGFYDQDKGEKSLPFTHARLVSDLPANERLPLEMLKTDSPTFRHLIDLRRNRREAFFVEPTGHIDVCNVPLPVRLHPPAAPAHPD
jgi:peptidylprolyl isomerase